MPAEYSFDVVSEFDRQELVNAIDQAMREITTRYDLKTSGSLIELSKETLTLSSANEMSLNAVRSVLLQRAVRRGLSPKVFDFGRIETAAKGTLRQEVKLRRGLDAELSREITRLLRDRLPKLKAQIQGDAVRVSGRSKDELQQAIQVLKASEQERSWLVPLQFNNFR